MFNDPSKKSRPINPNAKLIGIPKITTSAILSDTNNHIAKNSKINPIMIFEVITLSLVFIQNELSPIILKSISLYSF